jgi:hypothetical protein
MGHAIGEDHKTGQARYMRLEEWTRRYFHAPGLIKYFWSGR